MNNGREMMRLSGKIPTVLLAYVCKAVKEYADAEIPATSEVFTKVASDEKGNPYIVFVEEEDAV